MNQTKPRDAQERTDHLRTGEILQARWGSSHWPGPPVPNEFNAHHSSHLMIPHLIGFPAYPSLLIRRQSQNYLEEMKWCMWPSPVAASHIMHHMSPRPTVLCSSHFGPHRVIRKEQCSNPEVKLLHDYNPDNLLLMRHPADRGNESALICQRQGSPIKHSFMERNLIRAALPVIKVTSSHLNYLWNSDKIRPSPHKPFPSMQTNAAISLGKAKWQQKPES